jgi:hypothetical protein
MKPKKHYNKTRFPEYIHLLSLDLSTPLLPLEVIPKVPKRADIFLYMKNAIGSGFVDLDGELIWPLDPESELERKKPREYYLKIKSDLVDARGNKNWEDDLNVQALCQRLLTYEIKHSFVAKAKPEGLSFFPLYAELEQIYQQYTLVKFNKEKIPDINLEFFWQKIVKLQEFISQKERGLLSKDDFIWWNQELARIHPILIMLDSHPWQKINSAQRTKDFQDIPLTEPYTTSSQPHVGYRVYGHFALIIFYLAKHSAREAGVLVCERCGRREKVSPSSTRRFCKNKSCILERDRSRK